LKLEAKQLYDLVVLECGSGTYMRTCIYIHTPLFIRMFMHVHKKDVDNFVYICIHLFVHTSICFYMCMYASCRSIQEKKGITNEGHFRGTR
jgi:hypothetical protein